MLPLTIGFLVAGPVSGWLSDRFGARPFATGGMLVAAVPVAPRSRKAPEARPLGEIPATAAVRGGTPAAVGEFRLDPPARVPEGALNDASSERL
jgi:MFS family permease